MLDTDEFILQLSDIFERPKYSIESSIKRTADIHQLSENQVIEFLDEEMRKIREHHKSAVQDKYKSFTRQKVPTIFEHSLTDMTETIIFDIIDTGGMPAFKNFCLHNHRAKNLCLQDKFWKVLYQRYYGDSSMDNYIKKGVNTFRELFQICEELSELQVLNLFNTTFDNINKGYNEFTDIKTTKLSKIIGNFLYLEKLTLDSNNLTNLYELDTIILPKEIGNLTNLYELTIINTPLKILPKNIGNLVKLDTLKISNTLLTTLPNEIGNLVELISLNISNNPLTKLPDEIGNLTNIIKLELNDNQLTILPKIVKFTKLLNLNLRNNQLIVLFGGIGKLVNLEILNISNNQLSILREEIGKLTNLEILNISNNQLTMLPKEFDNLTKLKNLNISHNPFTQKEINRIKLKIGNITSLTY